MRLTFLAFACLFLFTTASRAEVRLDLSTGAAYAKTRKEMAAQVTDLARVELEYALFAFEIEAFSALDAAALTLSGAGHKTVQVSDAFYDWLAARLHGKTVTEIFEGAQDHLAATNPWKIDRDLVRLKIEAQAIHAKSLAGLLRLQIERNEYPENREKFEKMLEQAERRYHSGMKRVAEYKEAPSREGSHRQHDRWREVDFVAIEIDGRRYRVPGRLLESVGWRGALDHLTGFSLQVPWQDIGLAPVPPRGRDDMAPYMMVRLRNLAGFAGYDSHEHFARYVGRYQRYPDESVPGLVAYRRDGYNSTQDGLRLYSTFFLDETEGYRAPQGTPLVFRCEDLLPAAQAQKGMAVSCSTSYWLEDRMLLDYAFSQANLSAWRATDMAVRSLLGSFRRR